MYIICLIITTYLFLYFFNRWCKADAVRQYGTVDNPNPDPNTWKGIKSFYPRPEDFRGELTNKGKSLLLTRNLMIRLFTLAIIGTAVYIRSYRTDLEHNIEMSWFAPVFLLVITVLPIIAEIMVRRQVRRMA